MPADDSLREALEAGQPVEFDATQPRESRLLPASWLERGIAVSGRLNVSGAVLDSKLTLRDLTVAHEVRLNNCLFEDGLLIEYCSFANLVSLIGSVALGTVIMNSSRFGSDVGLHGLRLRVATGWQALGVYDCTFEGVIGR